MDKFKILSICCLTSFLSSGVQCMESISYSNQLDRARGALIEAKTIFSNHKSSNLCKSPNKCRICVNNESFVLDWEETVKGLAEKIEEEKELGSPTIEK